MYKNELAQVQSAFDQADLSEPVKRQYEPAFPIGEKSEAIITATRVGGPPWQNDDRIFLSIELTHPVSDRSETMWLPLVNLTPAATKWVKSQLKNLNYDTDDTPLSDIESHMEEWIGMTVEIFTKRNNRGKVQFYVNHVIADADTSFNASSDSNADEDIPF